MTEKESHEEEMVDVPFPDVQLLVENGSRRLCFLVEQGQAYSPESLKLVENLKKIFVCLDNWRM